MTREIRITPNTGRIYKAIRNVVFGAAGLVVCGTVKIAESFNSAWDYIQQKGGELTVRIGTEGIFGEAKDGYIHTDNGFVLDASVLEFSNKARKHENRY